MNRSDYRLFGAREMALRGAQLPQTKLTVDQVRYVKKNPYGRTQKQLASEMGVHYGTIQKILYGITWGDV